MLKPINTASSPLNINVGHFQSVPWIPSYCLHETWPVNLVPCESSGVRQLANRNLVDFTPMASADWFALENKWTRLKNFGIAIRQRADSVLFFSQKPMAELDRAEVAVCGETANSVRVLQALMQRRYGLRIGRWTRSVDEQDDTTPRLLIQNQAVQERHRGRFDYVYDLGQEWFDWTGTPLVSAVWVHRAGAAPAAVEAIENLLFSALQRYRANPSAAISDHRRRHGWSMSVEEIQQLHTNFEYELGDAAEEGLRRLRAEQPADVEGFANA
jgi:chorismate dehydratase